MFTQAFNTLPKIDYLPEYDQPDYPGIHAVMYDGLAKEGTSTKIFAYIGFPAGASAENPVPAVVLVHGGGGHAFPEWIKVWNQRGYAAIAMCNTGHFPKRPGKIDIYGPSDWTHELEEMHLTRDGWTLIPDNDGMKSYEQELSTQWMYHAVGSVILAHNLLRADERVDKDRIGITGISWGGVITSITMGYDNRFAFYIPVYGCAHLGESLTWMKDCFTPGALKLWDATKRLDRARGPILWVCWASDEAFSINTNDASYGDTMDKSVFSMRIDMLHGHVQGWTPLEIYRFADNAVKGGPPLTRVLSQPDSRNGRQAEMKIEPAEDTVRIEAACYYITEKLSFNEKSQIQQQWQEAQCDYDKDSGVIRAELPEEAYSYYIEVRNFCPEGCYVVSSRFITL